MANYNELKASIEQQIRSNGNQEITGDILQGILLGMLDYAAGGYEESDVMYGVEWDVTNPDPAMTRIGNMALHRQLPIQNRMKGCLLNDDGDVVEYLNPTNWNAHALDGSRGQVMVELPEHYRKFETDGNIRRCKMSEYPLPGFHRVPKMYISAYEATVQRSTNKLSSVKNTSADYRGGNNNAELDGAYNSLLGRPATSINRGVFRSYARNRNASATTEWNCLVYNAYKAVFWLFSTEYANRNSQMAFVSEKDANGFKSGGLGDGATTINYKGWGTYNNYFPLLPCGHSDSLGNGSGEVAYEIGGNIASSLYVNRYRGIENPFGHIWKWADGINVRVSADYANGGDNTSKVYVSENPAYFNDSDYNGYVVQGNEGREKGYVRELVFGENGDIMPAVTGGSDTTYWADSHDINIPTSETLRAVLLGGRADSKGDGGLSYINTQQAPTRSYAYIGTRLCFIPQNS